MRTVRSRNSLNTLYKGGRGIPVEIRELKLKKRPAAAEFIAWLRVLRSLG
ncbi:MAG: hypothetical protein GY757_19720, partial [bacterium]|nr:hypothetical protein [bacterium]